MIVSTKGRYALRVMVALAQRGGEDYLPIKEVAEQEEISLKYLESIMTILSKAACGRAPRQGGGYRLNRASEKYTVGQHPQAHRGRPFCRILHCGGALCLRPQLLLRDKAHVG